MKYGDFSMKKAYTFYVSVVADPVERNDYPHFFFENKKRLYTKWTKMKIETSHTFTTFLINRAACMYYPL